MGLLPDDNGPLQHRRVTPKVEFVLARVGVVPGTQLENRESLARRLVRPALGWEARHAGVLDARFFEKQIDLTLQAVDFRPGPDLSIGVARNPIRPILR